ncbi:unnamed protein product [Eretmochelys imbricata]
MGLFRFRRQLIKGRYDKGIRERERHGGDELGGPVRSIPREQRSAGVTAKPHAAEEGMALSQPACGMPGNPASPPQTKNVAGFQGRPLAGRTRQCGGGGESPAVHSQDPGSCLCKLRLMLVDCIQMEFNFKVKLFKKNKFSVTSQ